MFEIVITSNKDEALFSQLSTCLQGTLTENFGERLFHFDNEVGKGTVRNIEFDGGISLLDFDVSLSKQVTLSFKASDASPITFLFVSEGMLEYGAGHGKQPVVFDQFQNIILAQERLAKKGYRYKASNRLRVNCIRVSRKGYLKKKNNNLRYLDKALQQVFNDVKGARAFLHQGSYSLEIADEIKKMNEVRQEGVFRTLAVEGRIHLILALQMHEQHVFETEEALPDTLSKKDLGKIHELTEFILQNISKPMTVDFLSNASGLSSKKLQLGFKVSYAKTVNEYIRQLKLELARDYLKNTDLSISEIVYAIGIRSRSYFSKIFFEAYGLLPTDYKKQLKSAKNELAED